MPKKRPDAVWKIFHRISISPQHMGRPQRLSYQRTGQRRSEM